MSARKIAVKIAFGMLVSLLLSVQALAADNSPVGYWKTIDDKTGQVLSIVHIYPANNGLDGKIVQIMPVLGQKKTDICTKCKGEMANKPMMGLRVISGMQQTSDNTWSRGRVLDPKSGNIYQGNMALENGGQALKLKGYVGLPMFGRSETWTRTNKP